jgi:hypothetical protein
MACSRKMYLAWVFGSAPETKSAYRRLAAQAKSGRVRDSPRPRAASFPTVQASR